MKKILVIISNLIVIYSLTYSQTGWNLQYSENSQFPVNKISFINEFTGWASTVGGAITVTMGAFLRTTNSGQNWQITLSTIERFPSFYFIDSVTGWLTSEFFNDIGKKAIRIRKTTNSGLDWIIQYIDTTKSNLNTICFINENTGFAGGGSNNYATLLKTNNSGTNWIELSSLFQFRINDIYFLNQNTGWVASGINNNGKLHMTTDGGFNWITQYTHTKSLYDIFMKDSNNLWVSCDGGTIIHSTNFGNNWSSINLYQSNATESSIWFLDNSTGFAGISAILEKTTNGGQNWFTNLSDSIHAIKCIFFLNQNTGWAGGGFPFYSGTSRIHKTTNGGLSGINQISYNVSYYYRLNQNYPNPFNPSTKINFSIPPLDNGNTISLKIYNSLGQIVETILNQELKPGTYDVEWGGANYSSGIYFYSLYSDGLLIDSKKMLLIK